MNQFKKIFYISAISLISLWLQQSVVLARSSEEEAQQLYQQSRYLEAIAPLKTAIASPQEVDRAFEDLYANLSPFLFSEDPYREYPNKHLNFSSVVCQKRIAQ